MRGGLSAMQLQSASRTAARLPDEQRSVELAAHHPLDPSANLNTTTRPNLPGRSRHI
jgi:hypothetical protein